jgi:asparagine synthase (glutamine-hydrolysing)
MCGIVGVLSDREVEPRVVIAMRDQLTHRGPDAEGVWASADRRVAFGFRRLAIVDLSADANQPFRSHDGRYTIVFNGEIYNFRSLRKELEGQGVTFRTSSDTEVLVESFRRWGDDCLPRLSGMYAFAVWDAVARRLLCARDRAGEKPFYYADLGDHFLFASELKALAQWPSLRRKIHLPAVVDFLSFGFVPDPKTIWEDCRKLPPGHTMWVDFDGDRPRVHAPRPYWDLQFDPDTSVRDWGPAILDTLQAATREMSYADVPVGAFLSGGVDSSAVVAALSRSGCTVNSFTVGFDAADYDERPYARTVAELYGTTHHERVVVPDDVESAAARLVWHFDEPFNDYSYLPTYYVCRAAREEITVALSGDGGDELFAGYGKYRRLRVRDDLDPVLGPVIRRGLRFASAGLPERSALRGKVHAHTLDPVDLFTHTLTLGFDAASLRQSARGELAACLAHYSPTDVVRSLLRQAPPEEVGFINAMRYLDFKLTLAGDMLVKVDRASMAVSLEVRPVFLHRDVLAIAARIPPSQLATRRESKTVLKRALGSWLPSSITHRPKMGFAMPLKNWITRLEPLLRSAEAAPEVDGWLDRDLLPRLIDAHTRGAGNNVALIHSVAFLRQWSALWLDGKSSEPSAMSAAL